MGYVTDFFGNKLQDIYAPKAGITLIIISTPPIRKGEDVFVMGKLPDN